MRTRVVQLSSAAVEVFEAGEGPVMLLLHVGLRTPLALPLFWLMRVMSFSRSGLKKAIVAEPVDDALVLRSKASAPAFVALMRDVALGIAPEKETPSCPVLAIWGDRDGLIPLAQGQQIAAAVGAELVVLPGIGHMPQREAPEDTARHVQRFAARLAP